MIDAGSTLLRAAAFGIALSALAGSATAATIKVAMKDIGFTPTAITAHVGDTIEWTNNDFVAHTATGKNGEFDVSIDPGKVGRATVSKAGTIAYFCQYHPDMVGTITVLAK